MKFVIRNAKSTYIANRPSGDSGKPNGLFIDADGEWTDVYPKAQLFDTAIQAADYYRDHCKAKDWRKTTVFVVEVTVKEVLDKCAKAPTMTL